MSDSDESKRSERLRTRVRQLILMRETGPKRPAWHRERMRLIWRLHDEVREAEEAESAEPQNQGTAEPTTDG
jgi:uncharacterized coiled-coil DUF342 family protein